MNPEEFLSRLLPYRESINRALDECLPGAAVEPAPIHQAMRYAVLGEGKRLRPILTLATAELFTNDTEPVLPVACSVEMVHCYSLVHDDLPALDNGDLRRGKPTCHRAFGEASAVLAGDALLSLSFELLAREVKDSVLSQALIVELAQAVGSRGLLAGQAADILAEGDKPDLETVRFIHNHKTGALITSSVRMGAMAAGAPAEARETLTRFGRRLGLAFQIVDDILDVEGSQKQVGKKLAKDSQAGKVTYPAVVGLEAARAEASRLISEAVEELACFGEAAKLLRELAGYIIVRVS